jgi:protoporphyrinogen/coproporphyrinogen III oxidase
MKKKVVVLGAGISGLTIAYLLNKDGYDVTVLEKKDGPGGSIETKTEADYLFDRGPNSGLETHPLIGQIVNELGLQNELVYASREAIRRYILRNGRLYPLPLNPVSLLRTDLFSRKAKLRLFGEPFIGRSKDGYYQSISQFVERRLGREFLDYAINPFVAGVYAGNPDELSVKSAFPKLYELEEKYGGLIVGTIKSIRERKRRPEKSKQSAKMFSFKSGMNIFPKTISDSLKEKVFFQTEVASVEKLDGGYRVKYLQNGKRDSMDCNILVSAIPAYAAADILKDLDVKTAEHLLNIYYPPVLVLYVGYEKSSINRPLDGFGFLIPSKEKKSFLGAIWSSVLFPERCENDKASFTIFVGGSRNPQIAEQDKNETVAQVLKEFQEIMKINSEPTFISSKFWNKAIPQYNLGYIEHEKAFEEFENNFPGFFLAGNYRGGISLGDCMKSSEAVYKRISTLN